MFKRREVPKLMELARRDVGDDEKPWLSPFKDYDSGCIHIDIKHLPQPVPLSSTSRTPLLRSELCIFQSLLATAASDRNHSKLAKGKAEK
tara:strand:+ start:11723 stop:11992 length:270 start_codon:yes stop_codon:yes gene_type:complete